MKVETLNELFPRFPAPAQAGFWTRVTAVMRNQPLWVVLFAGLATAGVIGWLDWVTGWELSMFIVYALPIGMTVWWSNARAGFFMAVLSGIIWWFANKESNSYATELGYTWAMLNRECYFCVVAFAVAVVRKRQDDDAARIRMLEERRQLEKDIVRVSEHEQQRIGHDLHDGLCQHLAAIGCAARVLTEDLQERNVPEAREASMIEDSIQQAVLEARSLARGISPVHVDRSGLAAALSELARMTGGLTGASIEVQEGPDAHLENPEASMHLYRIAQEAVANAIRHARASRVVISLERAGDRLFLMIEDNGSGLSLSKSADSGGMGLRTMRYRAQSLGATLEFENTPGGGTRVVCRLPLQTPADRP